jgi:hypothetical protein
MIKHVIEVKDLEKWVKTLKKKYGSIVQNNIKFELKKLIEQKTYEVSM